MNTKSALTAFFVDAMKMKTKRNAIMILALAAFGFFMKPMAFVCLISLFQILFYNDENGKLAVYFAPMTKKCTVFGRYLFTLSLIILCIAINLLFDLVAPVLYPEYIQGNMYLYTLMSVAMIALFSIEMPFFFWLGYKNFRIVNLLVLVGSMVLMARVISGEAIYSSALAFAENAFFFPLLIAAAIALMICSSLISARIFAAKDV